MTDAVTLAVIARLDAKQDRLEAAMADGFAVITGHLVGLAGRVAGLEIRLSAMEDWSADTTARLERIERRLGLVEAPPA